MFEINREIESVWLILGSHCNCNCVYCSQHATVNTGVKNETDGSIFAFFEKIVRYNQNKKLRIIFYGGEPLLYWDNIVEVVARTKNLNIGYSIITNGRALTEEKVSFINENNIHIQLSWDGYGSKKTRRYNVIDEKKDLILTINNLSIHSVVSAAIYPIELFESIEQLDDEYYRKNGKCLRGDIALIENNTPESTGIFDIDIKRLETEVQEIVDEAIASPKDNLRTKWVGDMLVKYQNFQRSGTIISYFKRNCASGITSLNMDLKGNLYSCHNSDIAIGNINGDFKSYLNLLKSTDFPEDHFTECNSCLANFYCRGGCKLCQKKLEQFCKIRQAFIKPIINLIRGSENNG